MNGWIQLIDSSVNFPFDEVNSIGHVGDSLLD